MYKKLLYFSLFSFFILLISGFFIANDYIEKSKINYTNAIKFEIENLIKAKKINTLEIAKNLSIDKNLINIIKNKKYDILYKKRFFPIFDDYKSFKHIGIHIIDKDGIQRYVSWSKKSLGKFMLNIRPDIKDVLEKKKPMAKISSGLFDITFKGMVPIFDKQHNLLGVIEVITHFNSISNLLKKHQIYSALILNKKQSLNIKYDKFGKFLDGYFISNKLNKNIEEILQKYGIEKFIKISPNKYDYIPSKDDLFDGYFIVNVPIKLNNEIIAHYVAFIKDIYTLKEKEIASYFIMSGIAFLFLFIAYIAFKLSEKNNNLIKDLNEEVENQIAEKLNLIYSDSLTNAYKKTKFEIDRIDYKNYEVIILNIKNFSKINEFYGFKVGDDVLKIVVKRIENLLTQKIYRINGDEFVFFSKNVKKDIKEIKHKFITDPIKLPENNIVIRLSFSFAVTKNEGNEILRKLSIALKDAKIQPFKDFIYYKEKPIQSDFIKFNSLLYDAIFLNENAKIIPFFQGIRDNKNENIKKYECLARLEADKLYSPFFFINIAKNSGFLFEITKIIIDKSFKYLSEKNEEIEISINITEDDLFSYQLKSYFLDKLEEYKINPNRITLEILEGITSTGTKNNIEELKELKNLGFKLAIDDFGVEYSNFERINELDIDFIKIDGKYIKNLNSSEKSYKIAKAITDFAHSLNIKVVAEFVENMEIQSIVEELGIEYTQGYCFSKPEKEML